MWTCCTTREPKKTRFLCYEENSWVTDCLQINEPGPKEVLVQVAYIALNKSDLTDIEDRSCIGHTFSGRIKNVGRDFYHEFKLNDEVFGFYPKTSAHKTGAFSELVVVPRDHILKVPAGIRLQIAAALPHIIPVAKTLDRFIKKDEKTFYLGPKDGYYRSLFDAIAYKKNATIEIEPLALARSDSNAEGNQDSNAGDQTAWLSLVPDTDALEIRRRSRTGVATDSFKGLETLVSAAEYITNNPENVKLILRNVFFSFDEVADANDKQKFSKLLNNVLKGAPGPFIFDIGILKKLRRKGESESPEISPKDSLTNSPRAL